MELGKEGITDMYVKDKITGDVASNFMPNHLSTIYSCGYLFDPRFGFKKHKEPYSIESYRLHHKQ
jgi:hypothetical protein